MLKQLFWIQLAAIAERLHCENWSIQPESTGMHKKIQHLKPSLLIVMVSETDANTQGFQIYIHRDKCALSVSVKVHNTLDRLAQTGFNCTVIVGDTTSKRVPTRRSEHFVQQGRQYLSFNSALWLLSDLYKSLCSRAVGILKIQFPNSVDIKGTR